jgi:predicted metallopeptidase
MVGQLAMKFNRASDTEKQKILVETVQHLPAEERDLFLTVGILTSLLKICET